MKFSALVVTTTLLTAATTWADPLVLHSQDSITIEGSRYSCDDPSRKGVHLVPGDHMNAGGYQLRCVGDDDRHAPPPPPVPDVAIESKVDTACLHDLFQKTASSVSSTDTLELAASCRSPQLDKACRITATTPDADCLATMRQINSGVYSDADLPKAMSSCRRITAACPALPTQATSRVDLDCFHNLFMASSGAPDVATEVAWMESCRDQVRATCVVEGSVVEPACVAKAFSVSQGNLSVKDLGALARACRTLDLRCQ